MKRDPQSHKGENGKVAVIGGSVHIHGAPIFSALSAEASGVDLLYLCMPACHAGVSRAASLNFQVHPYQRDELRPSDIEWIVELLATMDCAVLGPGVSKEKRSVATLLDLIAAVPCPLVLDATALQRETLEAVEGKSTVLTPHLGELERMGLRPENIGRAARENAVTIVIKGPVDRIADASGTVTEVSGGNAGLTVGGTGDALAGLIAGLIAQGTEPADAARAASRIIKKAGEDLFETHGYAYRSVDVIAQIPRLLKTMDI